MRSKTSGVINLKHHLDISTKPRNKLCRKKKNTTPAQTRNAPGVRKTINRSASSTTIILIRNTGAYFVPDDGNILTCPLCKSRYCLSCEVPFHENETCEGFLEAKQRAAEIDRDIERRKQEEAASKKAVKEKSRPCPRCGVNIDKYTGCDHVTCE